MAFDEPWYVESRAESYAILQLTERADVNLSRLRGIPGLDLLLSLGTGSHTRPLPYDKIKDWGQLEWARPVIDVVFDGGQDAVDLQLRALLTDRYVRLQTELEAASDDLDDASERNLDLLRQEAEGLIADNDALIDDVCARLTA